MTLFFNSAQRGFPRPSLESTWPFNDKFQTRHKAKLDPSRDKNILKQKYPIQLFSSRKTITMSKTRKAARQHGQQVLEAGCSTHRRPVDLALPPPPRRSCYSHQTSSKNLCLFSVQSGVSFLSAKNNGRQAMHENSKPKIGMSA